MPVPPHQRKNTPSTDTRIGGGERKSEIHQRRKHAFDANPSKWGASGGLKIVTREKRVLDADHRFTGGDKNGGVAIFRGRGTARTWISSFCKNEVRGGLGGGYDVEFLQAKGVADPSLHQPRSILLRQLRNKLTKR